MQILLRKIRTLYRLLFEPKKLIIILGIKCGIFNWMSDESFLKMIFPVRVGYKLNLKNPQTFNEKLQWLKLYDRKPEYTIMVDKYAVKKYVADKIGEEYIIPTLGVWDKPEDIDFDKLPNQFVLKCTHDSAGLVICKDKSKLDICDARNKLRRAFKRNFYYYGREWPYKNVKPRIIAEKYMVDTETRELRDYKFFCFNGVAKCFKIDFDRFIEHHANYYDPKGNLLHFGEQVCMPDYSRALKMPKNLELMKKLAEVLSKDVPFLRADFYEVDGKTYLGELTFYPASGFGKFIPESFDYKMGEWIEQRKIS